MSNTVEELEAKIDLLETAARIDADRLDQAREELEGYAQELSKTIAERDKAKAELASMSDVLMLAQSERHDLRERVELLQAQRSEALDLLEELDDARAQLRQAAPCTTGGEGWIYWDYWDDHANRTLWKVIGPAPFGGVRLDNEEQARELVECLNAITGRVPPAPKPAPPREPNDSDRTAEALAQAIADFGGGGLTVTVSGSELRLSPGPPPSCVPEVES